MPQNESADFYKIVDLLASAGADFVIIGGLALQIVGGDYVTVDVDFAFARRRENARKIVDALAPYRPRPYQWPEGLPFVWDEQTVMNMTTLTLDTDLGRIDFLAEPDGAPPYEVLKERAGSVEVEGLQVPVASIDDLIAMKRAAGRPKDLAHIAELETIKRLLAESDSATD
ncbi:MAG: nucleotidyltransferase [Armatimonadetes bacterium]|nr:nucleotidyltransferase [Armatimonadota bacterium]